MDKKIVLDLLREEVSSCKKCPELVASRTQTVFSSGSHDAELMVAGESPGHTEDFKGLPFVGESGELLDNIFKACKLQRDDIYVCNIIKCHPPGNRNPTDEEICNCRNFLDKQIEIVSPKYLLLLGSVASKTLLGGVVSSLRGKWYEYKSIPTMVSYHPSFLLRQPEMKKEAGKDFRMLLTKMKKEINVK